MSNETLLIQREVEVAFSSFTEIAEEVGFRVESDRVVIAERYDADGSIADEYKITYTIEKVNK